MDKKQKIKNYIINFLPKAKTFKKHTTYTYKHMCEKHIEEYVSNDEMLNAFIELDYEVKQYRYNSNKYYVKCNFKKISSLDKILDEQFDNKINRYYN